MLAIKVNGRQLLGRSAGCGHEKPVGTSQARIRDRSRDAPPVNPCASPDRLGCRPGRQACRTAQPALLIEDRTLTLTVDESIRRVRLALASPVQGRHGQPPRSSSAAPIITALASVFARISTRLQPPDRRQQPDLSGRKQDVSPAAGVPSVRCPGQAGDGRHLRLAAQPGRRHALFSMKHPFAYLSATAGLDQKPL